MELAFLLVQVFDQSAASLLHLIQSSLQSDPEGSHVLLPLPDLVIRVLRMPYVVGDELLQLCLPSRLKVRVIDILDLLHESVHVLNQDIIPSNEHSLLLLSCLLLASV